MRHILTTGLLWFSAIGCGLMAGVYFALRAAARCPASVDRVLNRVKRP